MTTFDEPDYGCPLVREPWQYPKIARSIVNGSRYWRRRPWWPRLQRLLHYAETAARVEFATRPPGDVERIELHAHLGVDGMVNVTANVQLKPSIPNPMTFTVGF